MPLCCRSSSSSIRKSRCSSNDNELEFYWMRQRYKMNANRVQTYLAKTHVPTNTFASTTNWMANDSTRNARQQKLILNLKLVSVSKTMQKNNFAEKIRNCWASTLSSSKYEAGEKKKNCEWIWGLSICDAILRKWIKWFGRHTVRSPEVKETGQSEHFRECASS